IGPRKGGGMSVYFEDITECTQAEVRLTRQIAVLAGSARIFHRGLTCETEKELGEMCLPLRVPVQLPAQGVRVGVFFVSSAPTGS
ncbi:MAG: hypothetical protein WBM17_17635, partial [Anaerolineales bacterium]